MTLPPVHTEGFILALPLFLLVGGLTAAEGIILNLRGRTKPRGRELHWACGAIGGLALLSPYLDTPVLYLFVVSITISLTLIAVSRLRAEWADHSRARLT